MSKDINSVVVAGRLTKDHETRSSSSGVSICRFTIANNYAKKNGDQWAEDVNYLDCVLIGQPADKLGMYLIKGRQVIVQGQMRQNRWEQNGEKKSKIEIVVDNLQLLAAPEQAKPSPAPQAPAQPTLPPQEAPQSAGPEGFDDSDIPF